MRHGTVILRREEGDCPSLGVFLVTLNVTTNYQRRDWMLYVLHCQEHNRWSTSRWIEGVTGAGECSNYRI